MEKNTQTPKFQRFKINSVPWRLQDSQGGRISKRTMWRSAVRKPGDGRKGMDGKGKRMASDDNENQHSIVSIAFLYQLLQLFFSTPYNCSFFKWQYQVKRLKVTNRQPSYKYQMHPECPRSNPKKHHETEILIQQKVVFNQFALKSHLCFCVTCSL